MSAAAAPILPKRLDSIQALRGIAAFLVLLFHTAAFQREMAIGNLSDIALTTGIWDRGWAGVDLFFVISGFIMVYVTRESGRSLTDIRQFLTARITRIYPLWWVCAGVMMIYFWFTYGMPAAPDRIAGQDEAVTYAVKSLLLLPQASEPILGLGWTLIHEMFFYFVFAGLLCLPRKYILAGLAIWAALTVVASQFIYAAAYGRSLVELVASPLSLEFIAGGIVGYFISKKNIKAPGAILALGIIAAVTAFLFFPNDTDTNYTVMRVAVFTVPFVLLVYGAVGQEIRGGARFPQWLVRLGNWSYSLYLSHYIVLVSLRRIYRTFIPESLQVGAPGALDNVIFALLALSLSVVTAALLYCFVEKPAMQFFRRRRSQSPLTRA